MDACIKSFFFFFQDKKQQGSVLTSLVSPSSVIWSLNTMTLNLQLEFLVYNIHRRHRSRLVIWTVPDWKHSEELLKILSTKPNGVVDVGGRNSGLNSEDVDGRDEDLRFNSCRWAVQRSRGVTWGEIMDDRTQDSNGRLARKDSSWGTKLVYLEPHLSTEFLVH